MELNFEELILIVMLQVIAVQKHPDNRDALSKHNVGKEENYMWPLVWQNISNRVHSQVQRQESQRTQTINFAGLTSQEATSGKYRRS